MPKTFKTGTNKPKLFVLRPTDEEIDLEARQWAEEMGMFGEINKTAWILGAKWARGVARLTEKPKEIE